MKISYSDDLSVVTAEDLNGFFVGWPKAPSPFAPIYHRAALEG